MANGFLGGHNDEFALGYYLEQDVELYAKLAGNFTLCDNYFASLLGPTFPNREYMHSAQSGGLKTNALPNAVPGQETGFTWATIWDLLEAAGVSWGYYFVDLPAIGLWGARLAKGAHHIENFYADAAAGTLPNVVFVDPGFTTGYRTDDHPHGDMRAGQAFSHNIVQAVVKSPVWPRTAMFLNYDEWGGFFDHVQTPPRMPDLRATDADPGGAEDFGQLGFRVPCTLISPYSRKGALASTLTATSKPKKPKGPERFYDHTSILKFIEWRFGLASLTPRDAAAANIGELLDFGQVPRLDVDEIVEMLPRVPVTSTPCDGDTLSGVPGAPELPETGVGSMDVDTDFDKFLASGFFESVGYDLNPRPLSVALGG
jgi:phospholipase C